MIEQAQLLKEDINILDQCI